MRPYIGMIASMLGMSSANMPPLPAHLPYVPYTADTGKRRTAKSRVNRAAWKCNEKRPMSDKKRGHLYDIVQTTDYGKEARVKCRRCGKETTVVVKTKQYTQNKKVLAERAKAA